MATTTLTVNGSYTGSAAGQIQIGPLTITTNSSQYEQMPVTLSTGDNLLPMPTGAVGLILIPQATNTNALSLRTGSSSAIDASGHTIGLSPTQPSVLALSGTSNIWINSATGPTYVTLIWF